MDVFILNLKTWEWVLYRVIPVDLDLLPQNVLVNWYGGDVKMSVVSMWRFSGFNDEEDDIEMRQDLSKVCVVLTIHKEQK